MTFQALPAEHFASQSALDKHFQAQCKPHNPSVYNSGNPLYVSGYQGRSQQAFQNLPEPQWVLSPQMQPTTPQSMQAVVGSQYCAPMPVTFFLKHKRFSHGSDPVSTHIIVDDQGSLAYTVDRPRASLKTKRVLRDAEGNPICTMRLQYIKGCKKWLICKGATVDDSSHIADVSRIYYTTRPGVRVKLGKSDVAEYSLRYKSLFAGRKQMDVMHYDQIIGQCVVKRRQLQNEGFLGGLRYCIEITLNAGYDHALVLCILVILDHYYND